MEAEEDVLGLGLSPGFKFQPEDDELVEYFLLPRILGQQLPLEGVILEDDPLSARPWDLLKKHKRKNEAFFFAHGQVIHGRAGRQKRTCIVGGSWEGQKVCVDGERLHVPGSGMEVAWRKYMLNFHEDGEGGSLGWVMHEYSITAPAYLAASSSLRLYRIRFSGHGKESKREPGGSCGDEGEQARAEPDLPDNQHISEPTSVFPTAADGLSTWPAATSYPDQNWHCQYQGTNCTYDHPQQVDPFQHFVMPDSSFLPGADLGDYAGNFLGGNMIDARAYGATSSSDQEDQCVMNAYDYDGAAAAAGMLPFGQGSSFGAIDESILHFELPEGINLDEFLDLPDPFGLEAQLHNQYSGAGMPAQHMWPHGR